ncbi:hypothetical protein HYW84_04450 [Candidatus Peregrinibacteria bacterium]|nr:hypothetical protein [Candidatus Peregrinibacteria bacterium]
MFDFCHNPETGKVRAVAVSTRNLPNDVASILRFVGALDEVQEHTDEIVFSPVLRGNTGYIPDPETVRRAKEATGNTDPHSVSGAVINMHQVEDGHFRPGKRIMFINIGKLVDGKMQPRLEVEVFHKIVHESRHRATIAAVASGKEPPENRDNILLLERVAYEREMEVLRKLLQEYEKRGMVDNTVYRYLVSHTKDIERQLVAIHNQL